MDTTTQLTASGKPAEVELSPQSTGNIATLSRTRMDLAALERKVEHYPEQIRTAVVWLQHYWANECRGNGSALRLIGEKVGFERSDAFFSNLLKGYNFTDKYGKWKEGDKAWGEFLEFFEAVKRYAAQAERAGKQPFIDTPTFRCAESYINGVRALNAVCKIAGLTGPTGSQKSAVLRHYALLNNHGQVVHVEAPANGRLAQLQRKIAEKFHVGRKALFRGSDRESSIRENLNETRTLIIDNAQRLYLPERGSDQPAFNWILEVQEDTGCTVILSFTTDFTDVLVAGRARGYFEQFIGRMGGVNNLLRFPDYTPAADLRVIARHFGLDAGKGAMEHLHRWSREAGRIRIVFHRLQLAQAFAKAEDRTRITLADLQAAAEYAPTAIGTDEEESE